MKTKLLKVCGVLGMAGLYLLLAMSANAAEPAKIALCHVPPSTPTNTQLIQVGSNGGALDAHLAHADWLATDAICEDNIDDNNCDGSPDTQIENNYNCVVQTGDADATCDNGECVVPAPLLTCPCWDRYTQQQILFILEAVATPPDPACSITPTLAWAFDNVSTEAVGIIGRADGPDGRPGCLFNQGRPRAFRVLTPTQGEQCRAEVASIINSPLSWCP